MSGTISPLASSLERQYRHLPSARHTCFQMLAFLFNGLDSPSNALHGVKQLRTLIDNPLEITWAESRRMRIEPRCIVTGDEVNALGSA
jgi:hypothetical protein